MTLLEHGPEKEGIHVQSTETASRTTETASRRYSCRESVGRFAPPASSPTV